MKYGSMYVHFIDIDKNPDIAKRYSITSVPAMVGIEGGKVGLRLNGIKEISEYFVD